MTTDQLGQGTNYDISDYDMLHSQHLQQLKLTLLGLAHFQDAPIIVFLKTVRDTLNVHKVKAFAESSGQEFHWYNARDRYGRQPVTEDQQH